MPVANQGIEVKALAKLAELAQALQMVLAVLPVGGEAAKDVREALNKLAKHAMPGGARSGPAITEKQLELMQQRQQGPQIAAMRAAQPATMPPPAPPPAAGAA